MSRFHHLCSASLLPFDKIIIKSLITIRQVIERHDVDIWFQVGLFPDVIERKVARHFENGDQVWFRFPTVFFSSKSNMLLFCQFFKCNSSTLPVYSNTGFCTDHWRILRQKSVPRIWSTLRVLCRNSFKVRSLSAAFSFLSSWPN